MSDSLTAAAQRRYAPHSLCVLWSSVLSRTAAERFVDVVAGRWERASIELEEELRARGPALSWPERSVVTHPRRPRVRRAAGREAAPGGLEEPRVSQDPESVAGASPEASPLERGEPGRRTASGRASPPRSAASWRGRDERQMRSREAPHAAANEGRHPQHPAGTEDGGASPALPRSDPAELSRGVPEIVMGSSEASDRPASRTPSGRAARAAPPRRGVAASARSVHVGTAADGDASAWMPEIPGHRARPWDRVEDFDDFDDAARRRFEEWTLERRWRDDALAEWRRLEF